MLKTEDTAITDDAMVLERIKGKKSKLIEGSYRNIKITTPEDLLIANVYLQKRMTIHLKLKQKYQKM